MAATPSLGVQLLADLRRVFGVTHNEGAYGKSKETKIIISELRAMPESPWETLNGNGIDGRWLARRLDQYGVKAKTIRVPGNPKPVRGYSADDLADPWTRYLQPVDPADLAVAGKDGVTSVTTTPDPDPQCRACGAPLWAPQSRETGLCARCAKAQSNGHTAGVPSQKPA